ncbi:MAG: sigma-70 family RNA polymerase sigma factor [Pirellulaceae bacterium]
MPSSPATRHSLIVRLRENDDEAAWEEFVAIYRPVIVRVGIARGLQVTDAEDLAQQVLLSVSRSIPKWEADPRRGRFRTWLGRIIRNAATNALVRRQQDRGVGGTGARQAMHEYAQSECDALLQTQWRREAFRWAADQVRDEFHPATWDAFWLSAVEGMEVSAVAKQTGKSIGAVYVAKSRVVQRLQAKVRNLEQDDFEGGLQ